MVKVGIIGIGFMGNTHFKIYQKNPNAKVVAISDVNEAKLKGDWSSISGNIGDPSAAKVDLSGIKTYSNPDDLIKDRDVDLVDICLPTDLHARYALLALRKGKNLFCEKPIAVNLRDANRMVSAARKSGKAAAIGHCIRFWPEYAYLKEVVSDGRYGALDAVRFSRYSPRPTWTHENWILQGPRSGGAALDLHIHDSDFVLYLFGKPKQVFSRGRKGTGGGWDDISTTYIYDSSVKVTADGGWLGAPGFPFRMTYEAFFEKATIEFDALKPKSLVVYPEAGGIETPAVEATDGWTLELNYFLDCIESGRSPEVSTIEDARDALAIVLAEMKSAEAGRAVHPK